MTQTSPYLKFEEDIEWVLYFQSQIQCTIFEKSYFQLTSQNSFKKH